MKNWVETLKRCHTTFRFFGKVYVSSNPSGFFLVQPTLRKGCRECLACPPPGYQDQAYLTCPNLLYSRHQSEKSRNWAILPILVNFTNQVKICCLIWRTLVKLSYSVRKTLSYEALTCSRMIRIIDPIFLKKWTCMIFGCGDCFTSLIGGYLAQLREVII